MRRRTNSYVPGFPQIRTEYIQGPHIPVTPPPPPPPIPQYVITGTVYNARYSGTGFAAPLTISSDGSVVSDASTGSYAFYVLAATNTTVTPVFAGGTFSPDARTYLNVSADQLVQDYAFWDETPIYSFTGSVFYSDGGIGVPGAIVEVNGGTITTDSFGSFGFSLYRGYNYDVIPHSSTGTFDPASLSGVSEGNTNLDFAFTRFPAVIFGEARLDGAPVGPGDVAVVFTGDGQASTDASGSYAQTLFVGYSGTANPNFFNEWPEPYWSINPQVRVYVDIAGDVGGQDYDITTNFANISGTFTPGQTVFVTNGTGTWQSNVATGSYGYTVIKGWSGTTKPIDWITAPDAYVYTSVGSDYIDQNFQLNAPFIMVADNFFDWSGWSFALPDRWFIYARNPVDLTYSVYGTNAGTVMFTTIADTGSFYHITGVTAASDQATLNSLDTFASPPLPPVILLSGSVFNGTDGSGLPTNIFVDGIGTVATDGFGAWNQGVSSPYTGYVAVADEFNGTFNPAYYAYVAETNPQSTVDFAFWPAVAVVTGVLRVNGVPQVNEPIIFFGPGGPTVYTDGSGTYTANVPSGFTGISAADNYAIPAFVFDLPPYGGTYGYVNLTTPQAGQDFNVRPFLARIEGTITDSSTGSGISVPLVFTNGTGTVTTDASGSYLVYGHYGWNTTATPYLANGTFDPAFRSYSLLGGVEYFNQNYTFYPNPPSAFLLSGFMTQSQNGSGFSGTLAVDGVAGSVFADATTGSYGVLVPAGYSGTIVPSHCAVPYSGEYNPPQIVYTNVGTDIPNQDYRLNAVTDIQSLDWGNSFVFINGTPLSGTLGTAGTGWAQGTYGTFWSVGYQDGTEAFNQCFAFFDTTLVNFGAPYDVSITCVYTGSQYTDNTSGGYSSSDQVSAEINGSNTQFVTFTNGSFGGTIVQIATIGTGCNDLNTQWGNSPGKATVPPAWFFAESNGYFIIDIYTPPPPPSFFSDAVVTDAFTLGGFAAVPVEVIKDGSTAGTLTTDPTTGLTTSTATVTSGETVDLVPHYFGGSFVPASFSYVVSSNKTVPFKFYGTEQTGCPIPSLTLIGLPQPNNASRNVTDPVNNLLWVIDESYTYVYYVDVVSGTFAGSVDVNSPFGCPSICYEPINRKLVVSTYDGSVAFINPVTKAVTMSNFTQRWPNFHNMCVDDFGTAYLMDIRNGGTFYAVDCNTELLVGRYPGAFSSDSICWASNIGQVVFVLGGFGARFKLFDPQTGVFSDSVLTNNTSFAYEDYYVKGLGVVLMSKDGNSAAQIIDISQGVNATVIGNINERRVSDACEDTCSNRLFVSDGNFQVSEYTMDGSYTNWNIFDNSGNGLNPSGRAHSRATNLVYYENYNDNGTIHTLKATTSGTDLLDVVWIASPTVNGANTTGAVTPNGDFISSAIGNNGTISSQTFSTDTPDYYQHFDQRWETTFVNYGTTYAARVSVGLTGTQYQTDGAPYISNEANAFMINNGVYDPGLSFTSNGSFGGNYDFNFNIVPGINSLRLQFDHHSGYSLSASQWFFTQADGTFVISKP